MRGQDCIETYFEITCHKFFLNDYCLFDLISRNCGIILFGEGLTKPKQYSEQLDHRLPTY